MVSSGRINFSKMGDFYLVSLTLDTTTHKRRDENWMKRSENVVFGLNSSWMRRGSVQVPWAGPDPPLPNLSALDVIDWPPDPHEYDCVQIAFTIDVFNWFSQVFTIQLLQQHTYHLHSRSLHWCFVCWICIVNEILLYWRHLDSILVVPEWSPSKAAL